MPLVQILSDLHLETPKQYDIFEITPKAPFLALLGDIGNIGSPSHRREMRDFLRRQLIAFEAVLFVPGNHEPYHSTWSETLQVLRDFETKVTRERASDTTLGQFVLLERGSFRIPGLTGTTVILGCSLFSHIPADSLSLVEMSINDFYYTGRDWTAAAHNEAHARDVTWLNEQVALAEADSDVSSVAIFTHWSPSIDERACDPIHSGSKLSSGFTTDLSGERCWNGGKVRLWASGHTHYNFDFAAERKGSAPVRMYANQRGYYFRQADGFDAEATVEL